MEKFIIKEMIIDEATELESRLNELNDFLICGKSDQIDPVYKSLLTMQSSAMGKSTVQLKLNKITQK